MVQKSAATLVTSATVFFCCACAAPKVIASAAALANSGTINFFVEPFMGTSLWLAPVSGASQIALIAPYFIYQVKQFGRQELLLEVSQRLSSRRNSTQSAIIVNWHR